MYQTINLYHSPLYSDGELLVLAECLKNDVENLYERALSLECSNASVAELCLVNDELKAATCELSKVISALEENCYDCSWCKN